MNKILFISNTANFSKFNLPFMKWCTNQGWQVDYCAPDDERILDCHHHYVLPIPRKPSILKIIYCIKYLRKILIEQNYDIVHCHTPVASVVTRIAAKKLFKHHQIKIIYTAHGFHFYKEAPIKNWLVYYPIEKVLSKYTDVLITINSEDYNIARKKFKSKQILRFDGIGVNLKKFFPNDNETAKKNFRKQFGLLENEFVIIYIAEFIPRKNHKLLFDILPELIKKITNLKVVLAGKGELFDFYKNYSKEKGLSSIVKFLGYTSHIDDLCRSADILLMPSLQEGLPISMIEAISTGLPVVCSNIRGHKDVIKNGINGYLCDLNNKETFVESIIKIYQNPSLCKEISVNNTKHAKKYSVEIAVERMAEIYQNILF